MDEVWIVEFGWTTTVSEYRDTNVYRHKADAMSRSKELALEFPYYDYIRVSHKSVLGAFVPSYTAVSSGDE